MVKVSTEYHDLVRSDVFDMLPARAGRVLDLGGGIGATSVALKRAGRADFVVLADQVADAVADGVDLAFAGDLEDGVFLTRVMSEAGPFDTVLCLDVLEHLRDPWSVVQRVGAALNPGGAMVISIPNMSHMSIVGPLALRGRFRLQDAGMLDRTHLRWFTREGAVELATCGDLFCEAVRPNIWWERHRLYNRLSFGILERFLAQQYLIRACAVA